MVDGDGMATWVTNYPDYQHKGEAMAFQVFNTELGGVQTDEHQDNIFFAHSGKQYLLSVANDDMSVPMDDWLISPRLDGRAQTVTFYSNIPQDFGTPGGIKAGYSMGDNDPDSFVMFGDGTVYDVSDGWSRFDFDLPEGAKYFAINVVRNTMFLKIDDITYQAHDGQADALTVVGYNVYRDGERLNESPLTEARYSDSDVNAVTTYSYRVSTVYEQGESAWSEAVEATIGGTGVSETTAAGRFCRIVSGGIELLTDVEATVYTADGKKVARTDKAGTIRLAKGLYVVVSRTGTMKVTVK